MSKFSMAAVLMGLSLQASARPQGGDGTGPPVDAVVSNACSTTIYTAPTGAGFAPLSPNAIAITPLDVTNGVVKVATTSDAGAPALQLEYSVDGSTVFYDVSDEDGNPFTADGFQLTTSQGTDCTVSDCGPNASGCPCVDNSCDCGANGTSVILTICY